MSLFSLWRRRRKLPAAWCQILHDNVPVSRRLSEAQHQCLEKHVITFLDEVRFEGGGGLEPTDEMRLTIAGYACLLLLGAANGRFAGLGTVVIYPESFVTPLKTTDRVGVVTETIEERLGESWEEGTIVLSWDSIQAVIQGLSGDCNVIVHEFAHQLDARHGITSGSPLRALHGRYADWEELLQGEPHRQRAARRRGRPAILDPYAFTSAQEFFAVSSEAFFMSPVRFSSNHPDLYAELKAVYGVDPASWLLVAGC